MDRIRTIRVSPCELANHHKESPRNLGRDSLTPVSTTRVGYPWNCEYTGLRVPGEKHWAGCFALVLTDPGFEPVLPH